MIWYPIKDRPTIWALERLLKETEIPKILQAEHLIYDEERAGRLNGSGLIIVNPPYAFSQELPELLEAVRAAVALEGQKGSTVCRWLAE